MARRGERLPEVVYRKHAPLGSPETSPYVRQPAHHLPLFLFLVCLSCSVIAIDLRYGFSFLSDFLARMSDPLVRSVDLLMSPVSRSASFVGETLSARSENEELRLRVTELQNQLNQFQTALSENARFRELLDLKAEVAPEAVAAEVLRFRNEPAGRILVLRGGIDMGLSPGQPVLSKGGQLLGRIVRTTPIVATVQLITDPACKVAVSLENTRSQGILYNRNGELFVPLDRAELIQDQDRVLTSHLSGLFPQGLVVGMIEGEAEAREKDPLVAAELGLMKTYRVKPILPLEEWVEIREVLCLPVRNPGEGKDSGEL